ncbi:DUF4861 domain-containing protein [Saccharobesus litoralis]|uniref:DUF4861 domain-containing protein n=1 Tax=Saccharobesus litoralis TaxID=2172099 RepID=A0A2S0VMW1_9ALTE|nr:DUF4861 family protein [Saccharobesus litoralis]AWB65545.1 DUF4861 domain-containing protein [Saccharobesus litoralis]
MKKLIQHGLKPVTVALSAVALLSACASSPQQSAADNIKQSKNGTPVVMAYGRYVPERRDDFAWENDKVAFRVYGPAAPIKGHSSGVDAWLKKVDYSIIDRWYKGYTEGRSYHEDRGEGYDPYHTGISRGVGGSAVWIDGQAYPAHTYKSFKVLESGTDKVKFTLTYQWETPLGKVKELKTITLPLGTHLYTVNSKFTLNDKPTYLPIAIGIATHDEKAKAYSNKANGHVSAWEVIHGNGLATGAVIDPNLLEDIKHVTSQVRDESHIWLITKTNAQGELSYKAGFAWQPAGEITSIEQWQNYLSKANAK